MHAPTDRATAARPSLEMSMLPLLAALLMPGTSHAADLTFAVDSPVQVRVNGQMLGFPPGSYSTAMLGAPGGLYAVEIFNMQGQLLASTQAQVASNASGQFTWSRGGLSYALNAPQNTTTTTMAVGVPGMGVAGMGMPGMSISVTETTSHSSAPSTHHTTTSHNTAPPAPAAMTSSEFASFLAAVKGESFSSDQLAIVRSSAKHAYFTCAQTAELLEVFSFGKDQVAAVELMRPHIVDPQNSHLVTANVTFSSDKNKIQALF